MIVSLTFPRWLWLAGLLLSTPAIFAQSESLENYVQEGLANNLQLKQEQLAYEQATQALAEAKSLFFPQVSFLATYTLAGGGRAIDFPVGDLLNPVYATLNELTESQKFPTDLANVNEQFLPNNFQETKLRLIQPLFNSDIYFNHLAQKSLLSAEAAKRQSYEQQVRRDIRLAYFDWLKSQEAVRIYAETEPLLQEILRVNQKLVEHHKATREVIAAAEFELSNLAAEQARTRQQLQMARSYFNFLLNRPLESTIVLDSSWIGEIPLASLAELEQQALQHRFELQQLAAGQTAATQATRLEKSRFLPQVNAVLDVGFQGFGYDFGQQDFWLGQLSLQWDLFEGGKKKARIAQARLQQESLGQQQLQLQAQLRLQVQQAFYEWEAARSAYTAAASGLRSAEQVFTLRQKQYAQNQASLLELLDARTQLTQARLQKNISQFDQYRALAKLRWASGQ